METLQRIERVMRRTFRVPEGYRVVAETTSADVDGWDSLSHAVFVMNIEKEFGVEIPLDAAYSLADVGALAALLDRLVAKRGEV